MLLDERVSKYILLPLEGFISQLSNLCTCSISLVIVLVSYVIKKLLTFPHIFPFLRLLTIIRPLFSIYPTVMSLYCVYRVQSKYVFAFTFEIFTFSCGT